MRIVILFLAVIFSHFPVFAAADLFTTHINSASNINLGMSSRWNALIKAADFVVSGEIERLNQIRKFSGDKDWYMRNATLIALSKINKMEAIEEAKKLLQDKALVVRSAAVEILATHLTEENKNILGEELNKAYNFNKKSSLWIRKQIVEKLSLSAGVADRHFFVKSLFDSDKEIAHLSAETLAKITGQRVDGNQFIEKWQTIVKQNNWL